MCILNPSVLGEKYSLFYCKAVNIFFNIFFLVFIINSSHSQMLYSGLTSSVLCMLCSWKPHAHVLMRASRLARARILYTNPQPVLGWSLGREAGTVRNKVKICKSLQYIFIVKIYPALHRLPPQQILTGAHSFFFWMKHRLKFVI
jgi:hypothetical protein